MDLLTRGFLMVLSDIFSIITILMCLVAKIPQIKTVFAMKSAKGNFKCNITGLLLIKNNL